MRWRIVRLAGEPPSTVDMITTLDPPFVEWLLERWNAVTWFHFPSVDSYYAVFEGKLAVRWAHGVHATHLQSTLHTSAKPEYYDSEDVHPCYGSHPVLRDGQQAFPGCSLGCVYPTIYSELDPHNTPVLFHRFLADGELEGHHTALPGAADCDCSECQQWSLAESLPQFNQGTIDFIEALPLLSEIDMVRVCVELEHLPIPPYKGPTAQTGLAEPNVVADRRGRKAVAAVAVDEDVVGAAE